MYIGEIMKNIYDYPRESLEDYFLGTVGDKNA